MVKSCIIWDWGGVCCVAGEHFSNPRMLRHCGLTSDQMSEQCRDLEVKLYLGQLNGTQFWQAVKERFPLEDFTNEELHQSYLESYTPHAPIFAFIKRTQHGGQSESAVRHALLSNLGEDMSRHILVRHELDQCFSPCIFSHEIGVMKPSREAFEYVLRKLDLPARECVFVDDSDANVSMAQQLGIDSVLFRSVDDTLKELREFGFNG